MLSKVINKKFMNPSIAAGFSSSSSKTHFSFNLVIRDHDQSAYANSMNSSMDPKYFQIAHLWNSGNTAGDYKFFGHIECGGQEPGKTAMSGRNPGDLYAQLHKYAPDTWLRSLTRSCYGNSVFPLHPNDLRKWFSFVHTRGKKVIFKVFDYNTNFDEMAVALQILTEIGATIEIAVPHSPDPQYTPFFNKKIEDAAKKAQEIGATLSVKRMVNGLGADEARQVADYVTPIAMKYGIQDITLHAHGDNPKSIAAFMHQASQHGIEHVRGDIVHKGSGRTADDAGTFPSFYDVAEYLSQLGVKFDVSQKQSRILDNIEQLQKQRDRDFGAVRTSGAFTVEDKVAMGMPDGGEAYTVEAIIKAKIPEFFGCDLQKAKDLFQEYYKEFRARFGMLVSVTPGHKRIEEGSITCMLNTYEWVHELADKKGIKVQDLDPKVLRAELGKLDYQTLYKKLNPKTVDALRNFYLPVELSDQAKQWLCRTHMRFFLDQKEFNDLDESIKVKLVDNSFDEKKVEEIVKDLLKEGKIPEEYATPRSEPFHPKSILQAAGKRLYYEASGAKEVGPTYKKNLEQYEREGSPISSVFDAESAECISILTGSPAYVDSAAKRGPVPSPEGLTKEQYDKELALYRRYLQSPPGTLIKERAHLLTAMEGFNEMYIEDQEEFIEELEGAEEDEFEDIREFKDSSLAQKIKEHSKVVNFNVYLAEEDERQSSSSM